MHPESGLSNQIAGKPFLPYVTSRTNCLVSIQRLAFYQKQPLHVPEERNTYIIIWGDNVICRSVPVVRFLAQSRKPDPHAGRVWLARLSWRPWPTKQGVATPSTPPPPPPPGSAPGIMTSYCTHKPSATCTNTLTTMCLG